MAADFGDLTKVTAEKVSRKGKEGTERASQRMEEMTESGGGRRTTPPGFRSEMGGSLRGGGGGWVGEGESEGGG